MTLSRFIPDTFTLILCAVIALASLFPCEGWGATFFAHLTTAAIALLFFMHGAKLSRDAIVAGAGHWRLHLLVFACTFVLFPIIGLALRPVLVPWIGQELYWGILYICALPATVQSAIAFTSLAKGNVAAAICSAAASSLIGVFLTPLLVGLLMGLQGGAGASLLDAVGKITLQLLVPFMLGQLARPWLGGWIAQHVQWLRHVDQGSILLVVYTAFSASVVQGLWQQVSWPTLGALLLISGLILAAVLMSTTQLARRLGFNTADEITIVFCGSKKSLASGVPMAQVLFAGGAVGLMILPLLIFHQLQLMVCAVLAERYGRRLVDASGE